MKLTSLRTLVLLGIAGISSASAQQNVSINFDTAANWTQGSVSLTSYSSGHTYVESNFLFTGGPALRNTTAVQDTVAGAFGTYAWRLNTATTVTFTATYTANLAFNEKITGFSFDARRWDASPSPAYTVSYSLNGGSSWTVASFGTSGLLDNAAFNNVSAWKTFSESISSSAGLAANQFIVRFAATGGERIMIDNFGFTTAAVPEPSSYAAICGAIVLAGVAVRRKRR